MVLDAADRADLPKIRSRIPGPVRTVLDGRKCAVPTYACAMHLWSRSENTPKGRFLMVNDRQSKAYCFGVISLIEGAQALVQNGVLEELEAAEDGTRVWRWVVGAPPPLAPYKRQVIKPAFTTVVKQWQIDQGRQTTLEALPA